MALTAGELLQMARKRNGLTQTDLAALIGTRQTTISRWERDERSPTVERLAEMLSAMGEELELSAKPVRTGSGSTKPGGGDRLLYGRTRAEDD